VDHIFRQVGREVARRNAELQYKERTVSTAATLSEHLQEFEELWDWWETLWLIELSQSERVKFDSLSPDRNDREAFRIIRNFAQLVKDPEKDFKIVAEHLAKRLGVTLQTACNIRRRFCEAGILAPTTPYVAHKFAARFRWLPHQRAPMITLKPEQPVHSLIPSPVTGVAAAPDILGEITQIIRLKRPQRVQKKEHPH
jgi:hypothetical protein